MTLRLALVLLLALSVHAAEDDFPLTPDSEAQPGVAKGQMLKERYVAKADSHFAGTEREYQIYLPPGLDKTKPAAFMVFQDGVIYQAPTVFDNLIAKREIPPLIGIFIKPGVVPAANENALPRFNRSYEYDSVTDTYADFLIEEFLPAIQAKHGLNLSTDPNARAIAGNSSGGICAFMVAWHRPDHFRRIFTGVGTYVGIHGADQLPVLLRKYEPKPLRIFLQSGEQDNDLYCGDWWMANQMMERSLRWNGYDVDHAWGKGGHNAKHVTQIFPQVLRWLWKGYPEEPVKANPRGEAKWRGYEVIGEGEWEVIPIKLTDRTRGIRHLASNAKGDVFANELSVGNIWSIPTDEKPSVMFNVGGRTTKGGIFNQLAVGADGTLFTIDEYAEMDSGIRTYKDNDFGVLEADNQTISGHSICISNAGRIFVSIAHGGFGIVSYSMSNPQQTDYKTRVPTKESVLHMALAPDQTQLYALGDNAQTVWCFSIAADHSLQNEQAFGYLELDYSEKTDPSGLCVDTNGWLYVATSLGVQVLDQAGRVNFIIPTPQPPHDLCFGGKDLSELFIACGDAIYKRKTKAKGYISGQMAPIKPPAPKL